MSKPLTKAQGELFEYLESYILENNHGPSIRQMMRAMGLKSPAPIQSRLDHLRRKGYVDWTEGQARTIRLLAYQQAVPVLVGPEIAQVIRAMQEPGQSLGEVVERLVAKAAEVAA